MDSREVPSQPHPNLQPPSSLILMNHNSYVHSNNRNPNTIIGPGSATAAASIHHSTAALRLPFNSIAPQSHQPPPSEPRTVEPLRFDGSPSSGQSTMRFGHEQTKKKRGRPRKYAPEGNIALGLSTTSPLSAPPASGSNSYGGANGSGGGGTNPNPNSSEPPPKRNRGRPPGSGKKQLDALGGMGGVGFTPHVIEVKAGEDIASKITKFSQQGPRAICVLSASGAISNITLRQQTSSGSTVTYEGRFEIVSLSGSFLHSENDITGSLSVSLASPDGRILGGVVAGMLVAGSLVQVVVGSFLMNGRKQKTKHSQGSDPGNSIEQPNNMLTFGGSAAGTATSPRSQARHSSELSEEQDSGDGGSSMQRGSHMLFGNSAQPVHPMQMYQPLWTGHNP